MTVVVVHYRYSQMPLQFTLTRKLCGIFRYYFWENWPPYSSFALYLVTKYSYQMPHSLPIRQGVNQESCSNHDKQYGIFGACDGNNSYQTWYIITNYFLFKFLIWLFISHFAQYMFDTYFPANKRKRILVTEDSKHEHLNSHFAMWDVNIIIQF